MPQYRKKPVVIQAEQVTLNCANRMSNLFGEEPGDKYGYIMGTHTPYEEEEIRGIQSQILEKYFSMWIRTLEGTMTASYGDFIIKGVQGEFYPCKPDIFEKTYESVEKDYHKTEL